jgi:hypothetical protein
MTPKQVEELITAILDDRKSVEEIIEKAKF